MRDISATLVDLAGANYPTTYGGNDIKPIEGESFASVLGGNDWKRDTPIAWEHEGNRAVRMGDWKLVSEIADPGDPDLDLGDALLALRGAHADAELSPLSQGRRSSPMKPSDS